uniref:Putative ovule protein n=1 Tax=Solanum chacoense TaxID=4108 RepID=A0A0V0GIX4_SOLCH
MLEPPRNDQIDKKRPSTDFMAKVQKDINPRMRAILIDWLVEVAEEYRFVPDMLHLTITTFINIFRAI